MIDSLQQVAMFLLTKMSVDYKGKIKYEVFTINNWGMFC